MNEGHDIVVLGGGPAGYTGAIRAAQLGARVALVESDELGGTCLNRGCIPSKALLHTAAFYRQVRLADRFGVVLDGTPRLDLDGIRQRRDRAVRKLVGGVGTLLEAHGVEVIRGAARVAGPGRVVVSPPDGSERGLSATHLLVCTGSEPLPLAAAEGLPPGAVLDSTSALELDRLPERLLIVGGGYIGIEFASIYAGLGCAVTVVEATPRILGGADAEIVRGLERCLVEQGVRFQTATWVSELRPAPAGRVAATLVAEGAPPQNLLFDRVLVAAGRRARTEGLGLEAAGVRLERGFVAVDDLGRTTAAGIRAAGDVTGPPLLAHRASAQAINAVEDMLGHPVSHDLHLVPSCVYTSPELAMVGITEEQARERGIPHRVGRFAWAANGKALTEGEEAGLVKVIVGERHHEILGVHILGPHASSLIGEAVLGIGLEATLTEFGSAVHPHPSLSEAIAEAMLDAVGLAIHKVGRRRPSAAERGPALGQRV